MGSCTSCIRPTLPADSAPGEVRPASATKSVDAPKDTAKERDSKLCKAGTLSDVMAGLVQEVGGDAVIGESEKLRWSADLYAVRFEALVAGGLEASVREREKVDWSTWPKDRVLGMVSHPWKHAQGEVLAAAIAGVREVCKKLKHEEKDVWLFANWLSIDEAQDGDAKWQTVRSLPAFLSQMSFFLVPIASSFKIDNPAHTHLSWNYYLSFGGARLELQVAMKLGGMGLPIKSYFFDVSEPDTKLTEIAPYAPGIMQPSPVAVGTVWSCCQAAAQAGGAGDHDCDRKRVAAVVQDLAGVTERFSAYNRLRLLKSHEVFETKGKLSTYVDCIRAVPFAAFQKHGRIPRSSDGLTIDIPDSELEGKRILYIAHKWWRQSDEDPKDAHPDSAGNVKHAWICAAAANILEQDDFPAAELYVWIDYACFDQDETARKSYYYSTNITPVLARCSYHLALVSPPPYTESWSFDVPEKLQDGSKYWDSGWHRFEAFHSCLLSACGVLCSVFESTIPSGKQFVAADMVFKSVESRALARMESKKRYVDSDDTLNPAKGFTPGDKESRILRDWVGVFCVMAKRNQVDPQELRKAIVETE